MSALQRLQSGLKKKVHSPSNPGSSRGRKHSHETEGTEEVATDAGGADRRSGKTRVDLGEHEGPYMDEQGYCHTPPSPRSGRGSKDTPSWYKPPTPGSSSKDGGRKRTLKPLPVMLEQARQLYYDIEHGYKDFSELHEEQKKINKELKMERDRERAAAEELRARVASFEETNRRLHDFEETNRRLRSERNEARSLCAEARKDAARARKETLEGLSQTEKGAKWVQEVSWDFLRSDRVETVQTLQKFNPHLAMGDFRCTPPRPWDEDDDWPATPQPEGAGEGREEDA